jgi:Mn2+/Fe2+ NRAMP family transporter
MENSSMIKKAPRGAERLKWLGPAFIWMLSAAGSGELLFTPRIASQYGYTLIWALVIAVAMKWFINREIGRYTVCTGATFFRGLASLPNKRWVLWLIIVPQLAVAVATIAGLAGAASSAIVLLVEVPLWLPAVAIIVLASLLISMGGFKTVEKLMTILAIVISLSILAAAVATEPDMAKVGAGFVPGIPTGVKVDEVMSWLGFMLAGAAGLMWFSYWTAARGYGAASDNQHEPIEPGNLPEEQKKELRSWIKHMTIANTLAVCGALVIAFAFLILGAELLQPQGLLPEKARVAETLGQLMGGVWGRIGFWFMIGAVFVTFVSTILSDQDGFGRMFSDGTSILAADKTANKKWNDARFLKKVVVIFVLGILPIAIYLTAGEPVGLLKLAGVIEAAHIPVVTALILYLNKKSLPKGLQPSKLSFALTAVAGFFFAAFAVVYVLQLSGVISFG